MSVELFLETKILSSLYLRVMIQGWGEGTVLHDGNLDEVAIIYLYILKLKHYFFFFTFRGTLQFTITQLLMMTRSASMKETL